MSSIFNDECDYKDTYCVGRVMSLFMHLQEDARAEEEGILRSILEENLDVM